MAELVAHNSSVLLCCQGIGASVPVKLPTAFTLLEAKTSWSHLGDHGDAIRLNELKYVFNQHYV